MTGADFSLKDLYRALDEERKWRQMSWAAVAREVNARFRDVRGHRPIATSTITGLESNSTAEGDGILQMLLWLGRPPESFVRGFDGGDTEHLRLKELGTAQILRWDTKALYSALDAQRQARHMTWREVALDVGAVTPAMLTGLAKGGRTSLPGVMRLVGWLRQPAAAFTRASDW